MSSAEQQGFLRQVSNVIKARKHSIIGLLFLGLEAIVIFLFVKLFGWLAYDRKYLRGKWFKSILSPGWRWAFLGMLSKVFTGHGRGVPWPIGRDCNCGSNVVFSPDELNNFQVPAYYQTLDEAKILLGQNVWIARGCCLITSNHDISNPSNHVPGKSIEIGDNCWLGANVVILPGVILGPNTIVGANAVVSKSFKDGSVVLGGVPARVIRTVDPRLEQNDWQQ